MEELAGSSLAVLCSVFSLISVIALLGLCVCVKSPDNASAENGDVEMDAGAKKSKKSKKAGVRMSEVQLREGARQSNGSVPRQSDNRKSHEDRALPEIPNDDDGVMPTDDEEEVDQGHYDVISRHQAKAKNSSLVKPAASAPTKPTNMTSKEAKKDGKNGGGGGKSKPKNHPYEKVKGLDGQEGDSDSATYAGAATNDPTYAAVSEKSSDYDPMYAGVKGDNTSDSTYAGVKDSQSESSLAAGATGVRLNHPYACVDHVGEAEYAQITEKHSKSKRQNKSSLGGRSETLESLPAPPVPEKHLDVSEGTGASTRASIQQAGSPSLPPRNSGASAFENIPYADEVSPTHQPSPSLSQTGAGAAVVAMETSRTSQHSIEMGGASSGVPVKPEPPYSKVTARESLEEVKKRTALLNVHQLPSQAADAFNYEAMDYDSINYDQIRSPGGQGVPQRIRQEVLRKASDRGSFTSDLYAEIGATEEAFKGQGSAGYSRMSEVPSHTDHAPTPPPLDKLKQLPHPHKGDELADPGYQRVRDVKRPSSVCSVGSSGHYNSDSAHLAEHYPEYATVDKAKKAKNRRTVHVSGNLSMENLNTNPQVTRTIGNSTAVVSSLDQLYARVSKPDKNNGGAGKAGKTGTDAFYDNQTFFTYQGTGARPKEFAAKDGGLSGSNGGNFGHQKSHSQSGGSSNGSVFMGNLSSSPRLRPSDESNRQRHQTLSSSGASSHDPSHAQVDNADHVNRNSPSPLVAHNPRPPVQGKVAPGYQTIGGVVASLAVGEPMEDPDYDTVEDRVVIVDPMEHDPNYESLPGSATGLVVAAGSVPINQSPGASRNVDNPPSSHQSAAAVPSSSPAATAQEITMNADGSAEIRMVHIDNHHSTTPWSRREHIYQEIQDAKNENIYTPDPTTQRRHKQSHMLSVLQHEHEEQQQQQSQTGGSGGGNGRGVPRSASPQYITNL